MSEKALLEALGMKPSAIKTINRISGDGESFDPLRQRRTEVSDFLKEHSESSTSVTEGSARRVKFRPKTPKAERIRAALKARHNIEAKRAKTKQAKMPGFKKKRAKRERIKAKAAGGYAKLRQQQHKGFRYSVQSMDIPALGQISEAAGIQGSLSVEDEVSLRAVLLATSLSEGFDRLSYRLDELAESIVDGGHAGLAEKVAEINKIFGLINLESQDAESIQPTTD